jgi:hypothetical protein
LVQTPIPVDEKPQSSKNTDEVPGIWTKEVYFHFVICHLFYTDTKKYYRNIKFISENTKIKTNV